VRGQAGTSFGLPDAEELYLKDCCEVGNPNLEPEESENVELAIGGLEVPEVELDEPETVRQLGGEHGRLARARGHAGCERDSDHEEGAHTHRRSVAPHRPSSARLRGEVALAPEARCNAPQQALQRIALGIGRLHGEQVGDLHLDRGGDLVAERPAELRVLVAAGVAPMAN